MHARPRGTLRLRSTAAASTEAADDATNTDAPPPAPYALAYNKLKMKDIVSLCKRRGIIFPSSKICNGFAGFSEYVPPIPTKRLKRGRISQRSLHYLSPAVTAVERGACGTRRNVRTPALT